MKLCSLRSSSKGNSILISTNKTKLLVDCGISGKTAESSLFEVGVNPEELSGIFVTHEHTDHIKGVGILSRRYSLPVFANFKTWSAMEGDLGKIDKENIMIIDREAQVGDIEVKGFSISHDAADPMGYSFSHKNKKVSVATDIGILEKDLFSALKGSGVVLLEANHDRNMLEIGSYPFPLKQRIRGERGHLSNDEAGKAAEFLIKMGTTKILLGHLSQENNYPLLAKQTVENILNEAGMKKDKDFILDVAPREEISRIFEA